GSGAISLTNSANDPRDVSVAITRSTRVTSRGLFNLTLDRPLNLPADAQAEKLVRFETAGNICDSQWSILQLGQNLQLYRRSQVLLAADAEALLSRVLAWHGQRNLYSVVNTGYLTLAVDHSVVEPTQRIATLQDWTRFLNGNEIDSLEGQIHFQ